MLLLSSVPLGKWEPLRVTLMSQVTLDERQDLAWAECEPELRVDGRCYHVVLLQPRYKSESLWDVGLREVEVYVCSTAPGNEAAGRLSRSQVRVLSWGVVSEVADP